MRILWYNIAIMKNNAIVKHVVLSVAAAAAATAFAARPAEPFSDGAVLQRGMRVPVWGEGAPGESVTVKFAGQTKTAVAGEDGAWRVDLDPMEACAEGRALEVSGDKDAEAFRVNDVLVGEVWFCAGQSNTELPLVGKNPHFRDAKGAMRAQMTNKPMLRFCYQSDYKVAVEPKRTCALPVKWKTFTPENLASGDSFSAMGVYFALELHSALGIPVGVVGAYWGGSMAEPWTPKSGFLSRPETRELADTPIFDEAAYNAIPEGERRFPRLKDQARSLWNEMVAPWTPYAIRGFIWYQGCNNRKEGFGYVAKMHALYDGWAKEFENPDLRLRFVQLAPWGYADIAITQMAQAKFAAEEPHAKMAVICDLGNLSDIHPNDKETVGQRLALLSLKYDYGMDSLRADSPTVKSWRVEGDAAVLEFDNAEGLYIYNPDWSLKTGLQVCGEDGVWKDAEIRNVKNKYGAIDGAKLVVASKEVAAPKKVRYLFERPWFGCIYNEVNLPLGAFLLE